MSINISDINNTYTLFASIISLIANITTILLFFNFPHLKKKDYLSYFCALIPQNKSKR